MYFVKKEERQETTLFDPGGKVLCHVTAAFGLKRKPRKRKMQENLIKDTEYLEMYTVGVYETRLKCSIKP